MKRLAMHLFLLLLCFSTTAFAAEKDRQVTVLAAFGTSVPAARSSLDAIGASYAAKGDVVLWAYTSDIIRRKLAREGKPVLSVNAALDKAAAMGADRVRVQSLHVAPAEEYAQLQRMIVRNLTRQPGRFKSLLLGYPLLTSQQDLAHVVEAVVADFPKERKAGDAVVLMGHGNDRGPGDLVLAAARQAFQEKDPLIWLATVEGALSFDQALSQLKAAGVKRVWLQPFMIVAGDHANNDLAGPEADSWASRIRAAGMEAFPRLKGLGELAGVREVFLRHTAAAVDDLANSKKSE